MTMATVHDCKVLDLPKIHDPRGNLTFIENQGIVPFDIRRVYFLYDVPGGETRAGHAHYRNHQLVIAASGSFDFVIDDGYEQRRIHLNRPYYGLYLPTMIWRDIDNFSSGSVCLVLASETYDATDYIRSHDQYVDEVHTRDDANRRLTEATFA